MAYRWFCKVIVEGRSLHTGDTIEAEANNEDGGNTISSTSEDDDGEGLSNNCCRKTFLVEGRSVRELERGVEQYVEMVENNMKQ
jgi:hypothetical protein